MSMVLFRPQNPQYQPHPRRDFTPSKTARFGRPTFPPDRLVKYSPKWQYSRIFNFPFRGSHWQPRMHTVVIAIDGASKGNHLPAKDSNKRRASWGVFFGQSSPHNRSGQLTPPAPMTNSRAELEAVRQALLAVREMYLTNKFDSFDYNEFIIKTDSSYIHDTFDRWVWSYERNGFFKTDGNPVAHARLIGEIHYRIRELEAWNRAVRFWRVDRKWNRDADWLANMALRN